MLCAAAALNKFRSILEQFEIDRTEVFATASLRNIDNSNEVVMELVTFENRKPYTIESAGIGSLNLYNQFVEKIIPKKKELAAMADGYVVEEGKPELIFTAPKERRTQTFLSRVLPATA